MHLPIGRVAVGVVGLTMCTGQGWPGFKVVQLYIAILILFSTILFQELAGVFLCHSFHSYVEIW